MSGHEDKGKRYIALLDAARVKGSWDEIPELVRKVTKHAPSQKVLIQTATAEHFVVAHASQRPQTASNTSQNPIQVLKQTIDGADNVLAEEAFQGRSCLAWAAWTGAASGSGDSIHTSDVVPVFDRYGQKGTSMCTKICLLRAVYIQGKTHTQREESPQTHAVWRAASAWIEMNIDLVRSTSHMAYWAEQILAEYGTNSHAATSQNDARKVLQAWSSLTTKTQELAPATYGNTNAHLSRSTVWYAYYRVLSNSLAHPQSITSRGQLATELRTVEAAYETAFLRSRKFPKATESNTAVEEWVEQVIHNWQILCAPDWSESDLGEGGRNALTRNVLDVLYRAATKTFHSLLILRRLFQVHKSLTEFELAYRCLDTYIELAVRARERAIKAGEIGPDSDEVILLTVSEGVEGLCSYGRQQEAQKAFELAIKLEDWLAEIVPEEEAQPNGHAEPTKPPNPSQSDPPSDKALQVVYRAVGIAKAHWARWTPFSETRSDLQDEALASLHKATRLSEPQLPTLYALALLCAETRDIPQALRWTKVALQRISQTRTSAGAATAQHSSFWHLLTLLLSSQQDFDTALQTSAAILDSILTVGLGVHKSPNGSRNGSLVKQPEDSGAHAVADLECDDLQKVIELQTSYLALIELTDGAESALNLSSELLSLYSKLFKRFEVGDVRRPSEQNLIPPKTSAGTIKSVKGSIFSRRKQIPSTVPSAATPSPKSSTNTDADGRPTTQASQAPTIQVTDEAGKSPSKKHHSLIHRHHDHDSSSKKLSKAARPATAKSTKEEPDPLLLSTEPPVHGQIGSSAITEVMDQAPPTPMKNDPQPETKQPLREVPHNVASHKKAPPPVGHPQQPPEQDVRLPTVHPEISSTSPIPRFPKAQAQKHALVILNKIWLVVATLYRRSHIFEDARDAIEEAAKAAQRIEQIVSATNSSALVLADPGWGGGGKSSDEIWADVYCSRAELLHAIANKRAEEGSPTTGDALREIVEQYEQCLMYYPNHVDGIIGLSNILLDYYDKKIDLAKKVDDGRSFGVKTTITSKLREEELLGATTPSQEYLADPFTQAPTTPNMTAEDLRKTPENLNRIAARDRAYGLLSTLTKLGSGWDNSEAWFALARAHELGGEVDKAKKILWWCIELEDTRPIRHWRNLGCGGYVL